MIPDLSTLRPPMNSSTFQDDSFPIAFPSFVFLDLHYCALSKSDFFMIFNFSSTLVALDLSGSDIISLPSIVRFVRLWELDLKDCKQLQQISELPSKIRKILASGCTSLKRFPQLSKVCQFNTCELQELQWVDLTGSNNIVVDIENSVPKGLLFQGHPTGHNFTFSARFLGSTIPKWFQHCEENSDENSFEVDVSALTNLDEISGIALYIIIGSSFGIHVENDHHPGIYVEYGGKYAGVPHYKRFEMTDLMDLDHVWLKYIGTHYIENNNGRVRALNRTNGMIIRSCGFYLVYKHEGVKKEDPVVHHEDSDVNLDVSEKKRRNSIHLMDGIQFSKRCRDDDDDDCNLESHWHPKQKTHSSTFGMQILDLEDGYDNSVE
ncbi:hypothetical protein CJ030_MR1G022045 [Morella rubra]|uniref:TMV resistance protein N n=1 Tax=Morella rubra TaxID=262757 RepID=A0A6A1WQ62_9ROSI|nr:hypothetical protein CJ030_MR1G022045 [Morella rubra]